MTIQSHHVSVVCPTRVEHRHEGMTYEGLTWCHIPADSHPLHLSRVLNAAGRWNESGRFGCLYLCTNQAGAVAEFRKALAAGQIDGEHHLASVQINRLHPVQAPCCSWHHNDNPIPPRFRGVSDPGRAPS